MSKNKSIVLDQYNSIERSLDRELSKYSLLLQAEQRSGVKKSHLIIYSAVALISLLFLRFLPSFVLSLAILSYPGLMTLGAVEGGSKGEIAQWLSYWLIIGGLYFGQVITGHALTHLYLFNLARLVLVLWLSLPATRGATLIYERVLRPLGRNGEVKEIIAHFQCAADGGVVKSADRLVTEAKAAAAKLNDTVKTGASKAIDNADKIVNGVKAD